MTSIAQSNATLTLRTTSAMAAVLEGRRRGPAAALLFSGPAIIASIAYMDPGNYATNIAAGAGYGYTLIWVVVFANLVAMLFQALSAKLGIVTGRNLAELSRDHLPLPLVIAMWIVSELAAMATDLAEFLGSGQGLTDDHLQGLEAEILVDVAAVDGDGAGAVLEEVNAGDGGLSTAGAVQIRLLGLIHSSLPP